MKTKTKTETNETKKTKTTTTNEILHTLPKDMDKAISSLYHAQLAWDTLTPLAKNEWICWVTSAKKTETRELRMVRLTNDLLKGKRRPCCWPGCPHRNKNKLERKSNRTKIK